MFLYPSGIHTAFSKQTNGMTVKDKGILGTKRTDTFRKCFQRLTISPRRKKISLTDI